MQLTRFILTVIIFNIFHNITSAQADLCDGCYVWEFVNDKGERDETTRLFSNDVEDILSQYKDCKVLQRARYAKLQEQINNEKAIQSLNSATTQVKSELKTIQAKRVIFGTVNKDFQGSILLRISFEDLNTSQIKSNSIFLSSEDAYSLRKRKKALRKFVDSFFTGNQEENENIELSDLPKMENNGNLSIGQSGGTVNQVYVNPKPLPRHLSKEDIQRIKESIPLDYVVDVNHCYGDECQSYGVDILQFLAKLGYNTTHSIYGQIVTFSYNERFDLRLDHATKKAEITVYELK